MNITTTLLKVKNKELTQLIIECIDKKHKSKDKKKTIYTPYIVKEDIYKYLKEQIENIK